MKELARELDLHAQPPVIGAGALVIPARMLAPAIAPDGGDAADNAARARIEAIAMAAVMAHESNAGREPVDVSKQNRGWDIESSDRLNRRLRFIEVKGRQPSATTVCVTKNEWLTCLNKRGDYYLAIVTVDGEAATAVTMIPDAVKGDPAFGVTSVNLDINRLVQESMPA